jgi:Fic family protein
MASDSIPCHNKSITVLDARIRQRLDEKLKKLKALRPLNPTQLRKLREQLEIEMTYNSNAIEGNSLTLRETALVLQEGITIKGKPLKDHLEAKDHKEALDFLYELVSQEQYTMSERLIRQLHQLVVRETEQEWAGRYRTGAVIITGAVHTPPDAFDVPRMMEACLRWLKKSEQTMHPVELAALLHHRLTAIHPFFDGNGRTSRLVMNVLLMRRGFPLAIILKNDRKKYYRVLQEADRNKEGPLILFVAQAVERSLDLYLRALGKTGEGRLLTLSQVSRGTTYSAKYLNLLARTGRINASKRGRVWYTTKEALESYRDGRLRKRA